MILIHAILKYQSIDLDLDKCFVTFYKSYSSALQGWSDLMNAQLENYERVKWTVWRSDQPPTAGLENEIAVCS